MIQPEMAPAIRYFVLLIFSTEHSRVAKIVFMLSETDWVLPYLQRILSIFIQNDYMRQICDYSSFVRFFCRSQAQK